jgi:hypothetical protein
LSSALPAAGNATAKARVAPTTMLDRRLFM